MADPRFIELPVVPNPASERHIEPRRVAVNVADVTLVEDRGSDARSEMYHCDIYVRGLEHSRFCIRMPYQTLMALLRQPQ